MFVFIYNVVIKFIYLDLNSLYIIDDVSYAICFVYGAKFLNESINMRENVW